MYTPDPRYGPSQPQYTPPPAAAGYPGYPAQQQPGYYVMPDYQGQQPGQQPMGHQPASPSGRGSKKLLLIMGSVCVVLLLMVTGSAYFFFFSGTAPDAVVEEYIGYAQDEDFASARSLATEDASDGVRFEGDGDEMEMMRLWFSEDVMDWSIREDSTSAKYSTIIVDKTLNLDHYPEPVEMRWDYELERDSGSWRITSADVMTKVDSAEPDNCLASQGLTYEVTECVVGEREGADLFVVSDEVEKASDCPDPKGTKAEDTSSNTVLCLEEY